MAKQQFHGIGNLSIKLLLLTQDATYGKYMIAGGSIVTDWAPVVHYGTTVGSTDFSKMPD